jgi:PKD repeat protein
MRKTVLSVATLMATFIVWVQVAAAVDVPRFGVFEQAFTQSGSPANPYASISATVTFNRPGGGTRTIPMFWDGGATWRVRFSPDATGTWSFTTSSGDGGLNAKSGSFNCVASSGKGGIRLRSSAPYHFEHQDGSPFWFFGDTMWRAGESDSSENLSRSTVFHYVDVRAAQGFNYVHSNMGKSAASNEGGTIWDGAAGQKVRPSFFQEMDTRVNYFNSKGITVGYMLAWAQDWDDYGEPERLRYARYVVARYSARNVVFIVSGEYNETLTAADYRKIGQEIEATDPHQRMTAIHSTGAVETFANDAWMDFGDYQQIYSNLHGAILGARDHNKPVVNSEYAYFLRDQDGDGVVDKPNSATLQEIRDASYDIVMAGGYFVTGWGTTYFGGTRDPGPFDVDASKNDPWEEDVQWIRKVFTGLEWWKLQPSDSLLGGSGTRYCLAETGRQYLAYVRGNSGTNALSLGGAASATYSVRRFDPRTGAYAALADYTGTGPVTLDPPDGQDWLFELVVQSGSSNQSPTVSISASKTSVLPDEVVTFSATANDPDGAIASHTWNWGNATENGTGAPAASKTHSWSASGSYQVRLTVTDNGSPALSATSNTVTITVSADQPPVISSASATPNSGPAPLTVTFSASATDPEGQALTYQWDFTGDGTYDATGATVQHTYTAAGHYDPVLRVSDGTNAVTQQLTVDADAGSSSTLDFQAEADTYIYETNPATNYGTAAAFDVGGGTARRIAYVRFNVAGLPAGATVTDARLLVVCTNTSTEGGGTLRKFAPTAAQWSETAPTWDNPLAGSDASGDLASLGAVTSGSAYAFANLQGAVTGNGRVTFVLRSTFQDGAGFASRENATASRRPVLRLSYTSGGGTPPFSVTIDSVSTGQPYSLAVAQPGALYYIDRSYTITSLAAALDGGVLVRTSNDDKYVTGSSHLALTVNAAATLHVCYDGRASSAPSWLQSGWTATTLNFAVSEAGASPMLVYSRSVSAGQHILGANHAGGNTGALSNYVVVLQPASGTASVTPGPLAAGAWSHAGDSDGDGLLDSFEATVSTDPQNPDTDGDGTPDEAELDSTGRTLWDAQLAGPGPTPAGGGGGGGGGCGATGIEAILIMGIVLGIGTVARSW